MQVSYRLPRKSHKNVSSILSVNPTYFIAIQNNYNKILDIVQNKLYGHFKSQLL